MDGESANAAVVRRDKQLASVRGKGETCKTYLYGWSICSGGGTGERKLLQHLPSGEVDDREDILFAGGYEQTLIRTEREDLRAHAWEFHLQAGRGEELSGRCDVAIGADDADTACRMKPIAVEQTGMLAAGEKDQSQEQNGYL